jgi:hypothetical protein
MPRAVPGQSCVPTDTLEYRCSKFVRLLRAQDPERGKELVWQVRERERELVEELVSEMAWVQGKAQVLSSLVLVARAREKEEVL